MLEEIIPVIEGCLKGSRVLEVERYRGSDGVERTETLRLHDGKWYGELIAETTTWLKSLLKDKAHADWAKLGGRDAESVGAVQRALDGLAQKSKQATPESKWKPVCKGPVGDILQTLESKPGVVYLRNVSRVKVSNEVPTGTPAARIQKIWPLAKFNIMLRLTKDSYENLKQVR